MDKSIDNFVHDACIATATITVQLNNIFKVIDALLNGLQTRHPSLDVSEVYSFVENGLTLRCPQCGQLDDQSVSSLFLLGAVSPRSTAYGGPNVAALGKGQCPGCGGSVVTATFDPELLKARDVITESADDESNNSSTMQSCRSYPYYSSLTISPDEETAAWISNHEGDVFEIIIISVSSGTEIVRFNHSGSNCSYNGPYYRPNCQFLGNDRLLVSAIENEERRFNLTLFDAKTGQIIHQLKRLEGLFHGGLSHGACVQHDLLKVTAFNDHNKIISIAVKNDSLKFTYLKFDNLNILAGIRLGLDGEVYAISNSKLYRVYGKKNFMAGDNCICFSPTGNVYCGGGSSDRTIKPLLHVGNLDTSETYTIPWNSNPIDMIEIAGDDQILVSNSISVIQTSKFDKALVTLYSIRDEKTKWTITLKDLKAWRNPILLSVPEEQWALIQSGKLISRISLDDGGILQSFHKEPNEFLGVKWLKTKRILCVERNQKLDSSYSPMPGMLEFYNVA